MSDAVAEKRKSVFIYTVLMVWGLVVTASLYNYLFRGGALPDPILLSIPTGMWLAVNPPLPNALREERPADASSNSTDGVR
jgi:hypothetical protein